jgi:hypothetical protein
MCFVSRLLNSIANPIICSAFFLIFINRLLNYFTISFDYLISHQININRVWIFGLLIMLIRPSDVVQFFFLVVSPDPNDVYIFFCIIRTGRWIIYQPIKFQLIPFYINSSIAVSHEPRHRTCSCIRRLKLHIKIDKFF